MKEISLNILDIVQNSIRAGASLIEITVNENLSEDVFSFTVKDNGCGMSEEMLKSVTDPFTTTRTTRKVGLGISLVKASAQQAGGDIKIESEVKKGTVFYAYFSHSSIDRQPLGDIASVISMLVSLNSQLDFLYKHIYNEKEFTFDTREIRKILGSEVSLSEVSVGEWINEFIKEGLSEICGGVV